MIKLLYTLTFSFILTLFYAFFTQLYPALIEVAEQGGYALWAKVLLVAINFTLILIPLVMIHTIWSDLRENEQDFYSLSFKKILKGLLLILTIIIVSYTWANYYENLHL